MVRLIPIIQNRKAIGAGFCAAATLLASSALAQPEGNLCVPTAWGVPGMNGAPEWWTGAPVVHTKLDDPRWVGATSQLYPDTGSTTQAQMRVLVESNRLHFSFHSLVDPQGSGGEDWAYVALTQDETSPAKIVGIRINTTTISEDAQELGAGNYSIHYFDAATPTSNWGAPASTTWAENIAVWSLSADEWAINFTVDLADVGISGTSFRMWSGLVVHALSFPDGFVTYTWPVGTTGAISANGTTPPPGLAGTPDPIIDIDEWGAVSLGSGAGCTDGVSLAWDQIGVDTGGGSLSHEISEISNNTFAVRPTYHGVASGGANKIAARWRMANWGSTSGDNWTDVPNFQAVQSNATGNMDKTCSPGGGAGLDACPALEVGQQKHQCMLVNLLPGTTPGPQPITFLNDSVYRNMDFVGSSYFERDAEISIKGLEPLPGSNGWRDVYLYVRTRNMPAKAEGPLDPKALAEALRQARAANLPAPRPRNEDVKRADGVAAERQPGVVVDPKGASERKITSSKSSAEVLSSVWPTYEVHVYYDTGKRRAFGKEKIMTQLQPGLPFGYYVNHHGGLEGWLHQLAGIGATLEEIAPKTYKVKIPDNGSIKVVTRIEAVEPGREPTLPQIGKPTEPGRPCNPDECPKAPPVENGTRCNCKVVGNPAGGDSIPWTLAGLVGALFLLRRRRSLLS